MNAVYRRPAVSVTVRGREGRKRFINGAYDHSLRALAQETDADRDTLIWYSGQTADQIVANFRKHGMPPPAFLYF